MNNPSPLIPQGSNLEQKNQSRARVRLAVFCVLSVHIVGLIALLMIGCRKPQEEPLATADTNAPPVLNDATNLDTAATTNTYVPPPETNAVPVPAAQEYTVMRGDTLSGIAKKFPGVTVKQIQEANPTVQPTKLQPGQKLQIPSPSMTAPLPNAVVPNADTGGTLYVVKSGDTLSKIATDHKTTIKAIRALNPNLTTDRITVGQKLKLPPPTAPVAQ